MGIVVSLLVLVVVVVVLLVVLLVLLVLLVVVLLVLLLVLLVLLVVLLLHLVLLVIHVSGAAGPCIRISVAGGLIVAAVALSTGTARVRGAVTRHVVVAALASLAATLVRIRAADRHHSS